MMSMMMLHRTRFPFALAPRFLVLLLLVVAFMLGLPAFVGCDDSNGGTTPSNGDNGEAPDPGEPHHLVRLIAEPEALWLPEPGEMREVSVYARLSGGLRTSPDSPSFESLDPSVAEVDAQGLVTAISHGKTHVRIESGGLALEVPVRVWPDLFVTQGWAGPSQPVALWQHSSASLGGDDTLMQLGADDGFFGGVPFLEPYGDYAYAIGSFPAPEHDTIYKLEPETGAVVDLLPLEDAGLGIASQDASAAAIAFYAPDRAFVAHRNADGNGDFYVSVFDPSTMTLLDKIVVPHVTAGDPYFDHLLIHENFVLLVDLQLDTNTFEFGTPHIYAIDAADHSLYDLDPTDPNTLGTITLSGINPLLTHAPGGEIYAVCRGDGFALPAQDLLVEVLDPDTFELITTLTFDEPIQGGPLAWDADTGRIYIGNSYFDSRIVTVDGTTHTIVRDASEAFAPDPDHAVGSLATAQNGRIIVASGGFNVSTNQIEGTLYSFDPGEDTDTSTPPLMQMALADVPGHIAASRLQAEPVYAQYVLAAQGVATGSDPQDALGAPTATQGTSPTAAVELTGPDGALVLSFGDRWVVNGPGADFVVYGDATLAPGAPTGQFEHLWREMNPGTVEVSQDGVTWHAFPTDLDNTADPQDPRRYPQGYFGITPTWQSASQGNTGGGDHFNLADVNLEWARYIRLTGSGARIDAVAAINHARD